MPSARVEERAEAAFKAIGGQIDEDKLLLSWSGTNFVPH